MKRAISMLLIAMLMLAVLPTSAFAAGKMVATQENFFVENGYSIYGYAFARIENTGDKPAEYSAGLFEIYDANGDTLASENYLSVYGKYLQPGEYGYVKVYERVEGVEAYTDVDDYMLTVSGKSGGDAITQRFDCTTEWLPNYQYTKYSTRNFMTATFTNTTDQTVYDIQVVLALLDDDGNILDIESASLYSTVGVTPGSSITVREDVSDTMLEASARNGLTPTHVDAFAFVYVEE